MRADAVSILGCKIVGVVLEVGSEEADLRQPLECSKERRIPLGRSIDDVVVQLDEVTTPL